MRFYGERGNKPFKNKHIIFFCTAAMYRLAFPKKIARREVLAIFRGGGRTSELKILSFWIQDRIFFSFKLATGEPVDMFILHIMS